MLIHVQMHKHHEYHLLSNCLWTPRVPGTRISSAHELPDRRQHGGAAVSAFASERESLGFESWWGEHRAACPPCAWVAFFSRVSVFVHF